MAKLTNGDCLTTFLLDRTLLNETKKESRIKADKNRTRKEDKREEEEEEADQQGLLHHLFSGLHPVEC